MSDSLGKANTRAVKKRMGQPVRDAAVHAASFWLRPLPGITLLAVLAGVLYANALGNGFVFDDIGLVVSNAQIRTLDQLLHGFAFGGWRAYRPIRDASYAIDYYMFGLNPTGFHGFNIVYHILDGSLVFIVLRKILGRSRPALLTAVLFIVHPVQTDSVTYIAGRRDLLFTLFYLIGFYAFIRYRETTRLRYLGVAGGSYYLSLLSKEMAFTLPLLCLCYDLIRSLPAAPLQQLNTWQALREGTRNLFTQHKRLYLAVAAVFVLLACYYGLVFGGSRQRVMWGGGLWPTLLTTSRIFAYYLKLLVFPVTLNADYSYNAFPISSSPADMRVVFAVIVLAGAWYGIYRLLAFDRWAAFGGLWFFVTLLPVSQIIPHHEMMAEHYLYLPSAGFFLTVAVLYERFLALGRYTKPLGVSFALIVLLLAARTVARNLDWKDDLTLWTKTVQTAPESARAHTNLGEAHMRHGNIVEAERQFREALRIRPHDVIHLTNYGQSLLKLGRLEEAENSLRTALRSSPLPQGRINLGLVLMKQGRLDDAEQEFKSLLQSGSGRPATLALALNNLGIVTVLKGQPEQAESAFQKAIRLDQQNADARRNLGKLFLERGRHPEAVTQLEAAVRLKPSEADFHHLLGVAYYRQGMKELAAIELAKALSLKMDLLEARALLNKIGQERTNEQERRR